MITLSNDKIRVDIIEETGYTCGLYGEDNINWILDRSDWGHIESFDGKVEKTEKIEDGVCITYRHSKLPLRAVITKKITSDEYQEIYQIYNDGDIEHFMREGDFGIHMPLRNDVIAGTPIRQECVNAHVWCGEGIAWIQAVRYHGEAPWLNIYMTEGNIRSYSISRDVNRVRLGIDYRGDIVLNPQPQAIAPGECLSTSFSIKLEERPYSEARKAYSGHIELNASPYTSMGGETIHLNAKYSGNIETAKVYLEDKEVEFKIVDNELFWDFTPTRYGEFKFYVIINGKKTWIRVNSMKSMADVLETRANFIVDKQQYNREGSHLDGAYLIYDQSSDSQYFDTRFADHNAGRERICMGLVIIQALLHKRDKKIEESLKRYVSFLERELFDKETGIVYNEIKRNNEWHRIYNYPWFVCFYVELFNLWGEKKFLEYAVKIIKKYYEVGGIHKSALCMPFYEIVTALRKCGMNSEEKEIMQLFKSNAEELIERNFYAVVDEGTYSPEFAQSLVCLFMQLYMITGEEKYLSIAEKGISCAESFFAFQPDFHMHGMGLRHWDGYWFGAYMQYGDLFPHQWNVITGEMYAYCGVVKKDNKYFEKAEDIYKNNICVFMPNGFAASSYLYPYKITTYASIPDKPNPFMAPGVAHGERYDEWANEQDWALYYAAKRLLLKKGFGC